MRKLLVNNVSIFIYALLSTFFISFTITDNFISLVMSVSGAALIQTGMLALFFIMYKKILAKCFTSRNIWFTVLAVIGIINALNGRAKELPIIGKYRLLK